MDCKENKRLHLQMIQDVITRMASNSFIIKGWTIALFGGLFTLLAAEKFNKIYLLCIILAVVILFWIHDAYYLSLERQFRNLYNEVLKKDESEIDFKMTPIKKENMVCVFVRPILAGSYGIITVITIILLFICK